MKKTIVHWLMSLALLCVLGLSQAHAYTHPCIPTTREELDTIKANLDKEPWKSGYAALAGDWHSSLTYTMGGPFELVSRNPHINLNHWRNDMVAVYNMARLWYFTGNEAYAQKARDILIAWATTHTTFSGNESGLDLGDFAVCYAGGASILRGTWPGWTEADTATVKNYFLNCLWPGSLAGYNVQGPANKGSLYMAAGMAIATFCDDTAKVDYLIDQFRTNVAAGLPNTLATGEMGETGRDAGHCYGDLKSKVLVAEIAWKQGIDLYGEMDNRLLACGEYYARNTFVFDNPFVPFGTIDYHYYDNAEGPYNAARDAFFMLQNAYKNRKGLPTPWIDKKMEEQGVDGGNFMFAKTADFTTATPPAPISFPAVSPASSGLTLTTIGSQTSGRDLSYSNGVWTITGLGNNVWNDAVDDCQFAYKAMTGDCAIVAKLTSCTFSGSNNGKAGLMIRDNLTNNISKRAWVGILPLSPTRYIESYMNGWTTNWGGSNWAKRSQTLPPGMPYWLKVERRGNMLTTYSSQDGTSWAADGNSYYADLPSTLYIGMFLTSGTTTPQTATFENVAFTGGTGGLVTTPAAPAALFATASNKAVSVRWLPSFGATGYDLLRSTTSGSGYTVIAGNLPADKTSYTDTAVSAGTTYYYVARAKNSAGTSGNSSQFYASLLPVGMVNLATTGTVTDSINSSAANREVAFDQNPGSLWFRGGGTTGWLQYDFGAGNAQVVKRYTVNAAYFIPERDPKDWQFQASNDGVNWTTLDTKSGQSFSLRLQMKTYDLSNTTAYRFYRFNVTANNGHPDILHIGDIGLWGDAGRTLPDGRYAIVSRKSNKAIGAGGGGIANGTALDQWGYFGADGQKWDFTHQGNGQYQITGVASGRVMDVSGISTANGAQIHLWDWLSGNNQKWTVTPAGDGYFKLTAVHSGKVADVTAGSTANGAKIIQWDYLGAGNQQWLFVPLSLPAPAAVTTRLQSHNFPTRYIRHSGYRARIDENVSPVEESQFRARLGLANAKGVSFESVNLPGYYLRVRANGEVWVDQSDSSGAFRDSATFERVPGLADSSKSSFRMWTDSSRYLRHSAYLMYAQSGSGSAFNADATFAEIQP